MADALSQEQNVLDLGLSDHVLFHWYTLKNPNLFSMLFAEQMRSWGQKRPQSAVNASFFTLL